MNQQNQVPSPRIALFLDNLEEGGVQRAIVNLARGFCNRGLNVDIVLQRVTGPFIKQVPDDVRIVDLGSPRLRASVSALATYLREVQPKALLASLHYSTEIAILAKHWSKSPTRVVVCEQGSLGPLQKARVPINKPLAFLGLTPGRPTSLVKYFYPWADGIVAVSQGAAEELSQVGRLPLKNIQVIYNPVITPDLVIKAQEAIDHPWFANKTIPVILSAGRLVDQKDFPTLIQAFAQTVKVHPSRLVILGSGPDRSQLETLIRQLSTNCKSGPSEILADGKYGYLTPVRNNEALADAILEVLTGHQKTIEPTWLSQFSLETVTQNYLSILGIA
jgi:glycosyltransferase involved in cell wall biosynthesis